MTLAQTMRSSLDQRSIAIRDMMLVDDKKELDSNIDKIKHEEEIYAGAARNLAEAFATAGSVTDTNKGSSTA